MPATRELQRRLRGSCGVGCAGAMAAAVLEQGATAARERQRKAQVVGRKRCEGSEAGWVSGCVRGVGTWSRGWVRACSVPASLRECVVWRRGWVGACVGYWDVRY